MKAASFSAAIVLGLLAFADGAAAGTLVSRTLPPGPHPGSIGADAGVREVPVRLDGKAPQPERAATGTTSFSVRFENLPDDRRHTPVVRIVLDDGTSQTAAGPEFAVGEPPQEPVIKTARGNFQEPILAGRITVQQPPCVVGLGVCDADFNTLFFEHGLEAFALYNPANTKLWYAAPANIPPL